MQALREISLDIPCGLFGLLGPNGAGKSSLMRTLATALGLPPDHTRLSSAGRPIAMVDGGRVIDELL